MGFFVWLLLDGSWSCLKVEIGLCIQDGALTWLAGGAAFGLGA